MDLTTYVCGQKCKTNTFLVFFCWWKKTRLQTENNDTPSEWLLSTAVRSCLFWWKHRGTACCWFFRLNKSLIFYSYRSDRTSCKSSVAKKLPPWFLVSASVLMGNTWDFPHHKLRWKYLLDKNFNIRNKMPRDKFFKWCVSIWVSHIACWITKPSKSFRDSQ